jgi:ABC-type phosphate transport system substrate-binding protein
MARKPMSSTLLLLAVVLAALNLGATTPPLAPSIDDYRVIVNPANPARELSRAFVRDAFLKRKTTWGEGGKIRPVHLGKRFPARQRFTREVLNKSPAQMRAYWSQLIFSGKGLPPPEMDTPAAVVAFVLRHRDAVGYLPASADPGGAAVVTLK